jgi:hypothetical protein
VENYAIKLSTYGLIFLGTPHQGSEDLTWGETIASIYVQTNKIQLQTNESLLQMNKSLHQHLQRDSEWLQLQLIQYIGISDEFVTRFVYETLPTAIAPGESILVRTH